MLWKLPLHLIMALKLRLPRMTSTKPQLRKRMIPFQSVTSPNRQTQQMKKLEKPHPETKVPPRASSSKGLRLTQRSLFRSFRRRPSFFPATFNESSFSLGVLTRTENFSPSLTTTRRRYNSFSLTSQVFFKIL